jgi:hypothetical protein
MPWWPHRQPHAIPHVLPQSDSITHAIAHPHSDLVGDGDNNGDCLSNPFTDAYANSHRDGNGHRHRVFHEWYRHRIRLLHVKPVTDADADSHTNSVAHPGGTDSRSHSYADGQPFRHAQPDK